MGSTLELLAYAQRRRGMTLSDYSRHLGYQRNTLNISMHRGKLSPHLAAAIAKDIGEPWEKWAAKAAMENQRRG